MLRGVDPTASAIAAARAQADAWRARLKAIISNRGGAGEGRRRSRTERTVAAQRDLQGQVRTLRQTYDDARQAARPPRRRGRPHGRAPRAGPVTLDRQGGCRRGEGRVAGERRSPVEVSAGRARDGFQAFSVRNTPPPVDKAPSSPVRASGPGSGPPRRPRRRMPYQVACPPPSIAARARATAAFQVLRASLRRGTAGRRRLGAEVAGTASADEGAGPGLRSGSRGGRAPEGRYLAGAEALSKFRGASAGSFGGFSRRNTPRRSNGRQRPLCPSGRDPVRRGDRGGERRARSTAKRTAASQRELQNRVQVLRFAYDEARQAAARLGAEVAGTARSRPANRPGISTPRAKRSPAEGRIPFGAEALSKFRGASRATSARSPGATPRRGRPRPLRRVREPSRRPGRAENAQANAVRASSPDAPCHRSGISRIASGC